MCVAKYEEAALQRGVTVAESKVLPRRSGARGTVQFSTRWPETLISKVDAIAKEQGYTRTEALLYFVSFGVTEYEREQALRLKK
jgi:hypothetical protein